MQAKGFATTVVKNGLDAVELTDSKIFDLLILDLGLPGKDGLTVLRELRGRGEYLPIIVLTARDSVDDTVIGLEGGANDYVTKPFRFDELLARIRVQLRDRSRSTTSPETKLQVGDISIDLLTRQVWLCDREIFLSAREFILLETFVRHPMQVMTREQLLSRIWGYDYNPGSNIVDVYVGHVRKKLPGVSLETVRGVGYRLRI